MRQRRVATLVREESSAFRPEFFKTRGGSQMSVSGCTSCQMGGAEALKAFDRAYQEKLNKKTEQELKSLAESSTPGNPENRPIAGAVVGSHINLSV